MLQSTTFILGLLCSGFFMMILLVSIMRSHRRFLEYRQQQKEKLQQLRLGLVRPSSNKSPSPGAGAFGNTAESSGRGSQTEASQENNGVRFSLRTLLLCVLVYGLLWTLTAIWGRSSLENDIAGRVPNGQRLSFSEWTQLSDAGKAPFKGYDHLCWSAEATAVAPFVIKIDFGYESKWVYSSKGEAVEMVTPNEGSGGVFWFFGFTAWLWGKTPPPKLSSRK